MDTPAELKISQQEKEDNEFYALNVDTADYDLISICRIGIAHFKKGKVVDDGWESYVCPIGYYDSTYVGQRGFMKTHRHGITYDDVRDAPDFASLHKELYDMLKGKIVVTHTHNDRVCLNKTCEVLEIDQIPAVWMDSAKAIRKIYPEKYAKSGYGLSSVANFLGIEYRRPDALEYAIAIGKVMVYCYEQEGNFLANIHEWRGGIKPILAEKIEFSGNPFGYLSGKNVCITGALSKPRDEIAEDLRRRGFNVVNGISKNTDMLIVGVQTKNALKGFSKSSKHRRAEELYKKGIKEIQILSEKDFYTLLKSY